MSHQLYRPSSLLAFLSENTVYPKKHLSQNFLIDGNIIKKIILAAAVKPNDLIVEIGPGPGVLTEALLQKGATVIAIEKDTLFANKLHRLAEDRSKLTVYSQDILTFPLEETLKNYPDKQVKVISNLPYHLTSPIIEKLIPLYQIISTLTLMVQKEVGKRCTAEVNSKNYSSFPLFLQYYSTPKYLFSVSASCFLPKPKVDSAIVQFTLKAPIETMDPKHFFLITRTSFQNRRKMIKASLRSLYPIELIQKNLQIIGSHGNARPQELSFAQFIHFASLFLEISPPEPKGTN